ncbi:hypothetical protein FACS189421_02640 [Bacteroidia bacterium]|nr:hypothetical protein FACS189421_02640 [Bacteroidia bacterium]
MRKLYALFAVFSLLFAAQPARAITITKADPVAAPSGKAATGKTDAATSLLPTVLGLATQVMALNAQQKALSAECAPNPAEIIFVDNAMKAYASIGQQTASEVNSNFSGRQPCQLGSDYEYEARANYQTGGFKPCFNTFNSPNDNGNIWQDYPRVGTAKVCTKDGGCNGNDETVSDIYDIFAKVSGSLGEADYTPSEAKMASQLMDKQLRCAPDKITAKQREMWGLFLTDTIGTIGKKQNTGTLMEQVGQIVQQGGGWGQAAGVMSVATQFIPQ